MQRGDRKESARSRRNRLRRKRRARANLIASLRYTYSIGGVGNRSVYQVSRDGHSETIARAVTASDADRIARALLEFDLQNL